MSLVKQLDPSQHPRGARSEQLDKKGLHGRFLLWREVCLIRGDPHGRGGVSLGQPDPGKANGSVDEQPPPQPVLLSAPGRIRKGPAPRGIVVEGAHHDLDHVGRILRGRHACSDVGWLGHTLNSNGHPERNEIPRILQNRSGVNLPELSGRWSSPLPIVLQAQLPNVSATASVLRSECTSLTFLKAPGASGGEEPVASVGAYGTPGRCRCPARSPRCGRRVPPGWWPR